MVFIDSFDVAGPAQRFQAANMKADEAFRILALPFKAVLDAGKMLAAPVYAMLRSADLVPEAAEAGEAASTIMPHRTSSTREGLADST